MFIMYRKKSYLERRNMFQMFQKKLFLRRHDMFQIMLCFYPL